MNINMLARDKDPSNIRTYLDKQRGVIDGRLNKILKRDFGGQKFDGLTGSMKYTLMARGKRLRPILAVAVHELFDKNIDKVIEPACAIEMIHAASLMFDDLPCMDNGRWRRGKKANHLIYGESTTILASTALWIAAFKIFSEIKSVRINSIVKEVAHNVGHAGLIRGQFLDMGSFRKIRTTRELARCYYLKTGTLLQSAIIIGALIGGANELQLRTLKKFGEHFGLAFQIRDDILDATSGTKRAGKDIRADKKNSKSTYVSLLGLPKARIEFEKNINAACAVLQDLHLKTGRLIDIARSLET